MSRGRELYRLALLSAFFLLVGEIAGEVADKRRPADDLEAVDCSDVLQAHGVRVS